VTADGGLHQLRDEIRKGRPYTVIFTRSGFETFNRVQGQGGREAQTRGILEYFEDLNRAPNAEIGPEGRFKTAS